MADSPPRKRPGKTIATGISIDSKVADGIRAYAKEHQWSFSKAIENLARIALNLK